MRTKILTLFLTLMSVLSVKAGNSIYIDDVTAQAGDIIALSVQMTNTEADKYCGFQFDVVLPEGVSFVQNDGFYEAELSTQRTTARKTNFFDSVLLSDGSLRILCNTSASNSEVGHLYCFSGTSGEVCTIKVKVDENIKAGKHSIVLKNIALSDYSSVSHAVSDYTMELKVPSIEVTSVSLNKATLEMVEGDTENLTATVMPANATEQGVTWTSSNGNVATVDAQGKVTAVAEGTAIITVTSVNGKTAQCNVVVAKKPNPVTSITLNKTTLNITEGDSETLTVTYAPDDADDRSVTWTSSNGNVATVDAQGKVTAVAEGTAIITATSVNGKTAQCAVVVSKKANPVTAIALNKTTLRLTEGENETLSVTYTPADADGRSVTWTTSNGNVATVDAQGKVTAVAEGTAIITATSVNGKTAQCVVIVEKDTENISFADSNVKTICIENWDTNGDGELSKTEAAAVSSLGEVFRDNKVITSFNELQYFTGLTEIGAWTFYNCTNLTSVILPNSITSIGNDAFNSCHKLISVPIPYSVKNISYAVFRNCFSMTDIYVDDSNTNYCSVDGVLFSHDKKVLVAYPDGKQGAYSIPNSVIEIGNCAFSSCKGLTSVLIPNSVTIIGFDAFSDCRALSSLTIPNSVTTIRYAAFAFCTGLTSITIPSSVTNMEFFVFDGCTGLTSMIVDSDNPRYDSRENCNAIIETSTNSLVYGCKSTVIPNGVTSIGWGAFRRNTSLTTINIPNSVNYVDSEVFQGCDGLTSVTIMQETPPSFHPFPNESNVTLYVPYGCKAKYEEADYWKDFKEIVEIDVDIISFADSNVQTICIENWDTNGDGELSKTEAAAVSSLGEVFRDNKVITSFNELQYFTGLTEICDNAFSECAELTSVVIPDNVTRIGEGAFWCNRKLTSVNIPKNVKSIEFGTFYSCHSLSSVTFPQGLESIANWAFHACNLDVINIPSSVTKIGTDRSFPDNSPSSIIVEDGNPVYDSRNNCNAIIETRTNTLLVGSNNTIIPDDITYIGSWAFSGCDKIKIIKIPNSVTCIDTWAFTGCKNMDTITIPNSVTVMKGAIFYWCI